MGFFKKSNPLDDELRRLEDEQRRLHREMADIEEALQNPPAPVAPEKEEPVVAKGAKFPPEPLPEKNTAAAAVQLKVNRRQARQARNRVIAIVFFLLVLFLLIRACAG